MSLTAGVRGILATVGGRCRASFGGATASSSFLQKLNTSALNLVHNTRCGLIGFIGTGLR